VEELLPILVVGIGALLFSQKSNAAPVNPYASIPSGAMTMGSTGMPLMNSNAGMYNAQPYLNQGYYPNQSYVNTPAYQQQQTQNGLVNLASGVINKLPNNLLASNQSPSTADKVIGVAKNQATSAAADAALSSASDAALSSASDAAAQAAVEQAAAADAAAAAEAATAAADAEASSSLFGLPSLSDTLGLPSLSDALGIGDAGVISDAVNFFGDWGW
jgi:hypothetical protein